MNEEISEEELAGLPFRNMSIGLEERVEDLLERLTLEEKFRLSVGVKAFFTRPIKRLGIPHFKMCDGPHGIGPHSTNNIESTYFPTGICRTATWNPKMAEEFGVALAQEKREIGYHMSLGPGINIIRSPLCGRNFEYQTEDPYLNKIMATHIVKGLQSQRIAACVKHYVCNNQETNRHTVSTEISERTLQEIYLPAFKATVTEADAWSFMSCYNKVNGVYGCENKNLLKERLRDEWGFRGFVVTDWFATRWSESTEKAVNAGLSLEMPMAFKYKKTKLRKTFSEGKSSEETLNENIIRLLRVMFLVGLFDEENTLPKGSRNTPEHQTIARSIAEEGIVLLKNENNLLPLDINKLSKIAILGPNASEKRSMGGGSSQVLPPYEITPLQGLEEKCKGKVDIITSPSEADVAIVFAGLNHNPGMDSESTDNTLFDLPEDQIELINNTIQENPKTIVVLISCIVGMSDWVDKSPVIMQAWYPGMEGGHAIANLLFGDVNPSGKLPVTFPKKLSDSPDHTSKKTFPGDDKVFYDEGIFVGYRHFDTNSIEPLFPFGYGLSYTTFKYENIRIT
ncbi:MAG: glycoside hydrolase family 3 C-terminal domain-containing protein, partial [Candidatus Lokiarchaeota archaeon]|nr:glycoside hydrolase family 3 C-terminal domain-containing protein [Candidatus Lokiarchaeota archaeon]